MQDLVILPGKAKDITHEGGTQNATYFAHITDLKQYGALVFDQEKSLAWLERKLCNAGLFHAVQITNPSARTLSLVGIAIVENGGTQYHQVKAAVTLQRVY